MKNLQKYLMILGTIMLSIGISACSKQPDFDAKSYVQSSLDAYYHGDYKDYANLLEIPEKDAKKEIEEDFNESIQQQFDDSDNITELSNSNLMIPITLRIKELLIMRKNWQK